MDQIKSKRVIVRYLKNHKYNCLPHLQGKPLEGTSCKSVCTWSDHHSTRANIPYRRFSNEPIRELRSCERVFTVVPKSHVVKSI